MRENADIAAHAHGYASLTAAWFSALYPEKKVKFINRGISGNRAADLEQRWKPDCLDLKPDWVSILIGINRNYKVDGAGIRITGQLDMDAAAAA